MKNKTLKYMIRDWFKTIEHESGHYKEKGMSPEEALLRIGAFATRCREFTLKHMEE